MVKTVKLNHLYDDTDLYDVLVDRWVDAQFESLQLTLALNLLYKAKKKAVFALELFCGATGSRHKATLEQYTDVRILTQVDLRSETKEVTQGDVLDLNLGKTFDLILDTWDNIELLPPYSETKLAASVDKHLHKGGLFVQRAWVGLGGYPNPPSEKFFRVIPKTSGLYERYADTPTDLLLLRVSMSTINNGIECYSSYNSIDVYDAIRGKVVGRFSVKNPVLLTGATAYSFYKEMSLLGYSVKTIFWDNELGRATWEDTGEPIYHVYGKGK